MVRRIPTWLWLSVAAFVPRLFMLGSERLWYDESFTLRLISPATNFWQALIADDHPPLWSIIQWLNVRLFGFSEFSFRLPGAILSALCVLLLWRIALRLKFKPRTAVIAALFLAFMPGALYFAQDGRMYDLYTFGALLALWAALRRNWYIFFAGAVLATYTQYIGWLYIGSIGLTAFVLSDEGNDRIKVLIAGCGVVGVFLPWLPVFISQVKEVGGFFWLQPLQPVGSIWPILLNTVGWRMSEAAQLHTYTATLAMTLVGAYSMRRFIRTKPGALVLSFAIGPIAALLGVSLLWRNMYLFRVMLPSAFCIPLVWAYGIDNMRPVFRNVAAAIFIPVFAAAAVFHYFPAENARKDTKQWIDQINADSSMAPIYYLDATDQISVDTYLLPGRKEFIRPSRGNLVSVTDGTRSAMGMVSCDLECITQAGYRRFWFVVVETPFTSTDAYTELDRVLQLPHTLKYADSDQLTKSRLYFVEMP